MTEQEQIEIYAKRNKEIARNQYIKHRDARTANQLKYYYNNKEAYTSREKKRRNNIKKDKIVQTFVNLVNKVLLWRDIKENIIFTKEDLQYINNNN